MLRDRDVAWPLVGVRELEEERMVPDSPETIFISYSRRDVEFAQRLNADLQQRGVATWIDELGIRGGDDWPLRIATAIEGCAAVLVIVSPDSMASEWVRRELRFADQKGKRVLPLIHRQCAFPSWFELRFSNVQWVDFSEGSYGTNLAELLTSINLVLTQPVAQPPASPVPESSPPPAPGGGTSVHIGGDISGQVAIGSSISQVGAVRAAAPKPEALTIASPIHLELVRVPAGKFLMGSDPAKDKDAQDDEQPQHSVYVPEFTIGKYPVTNVQYAAFVRAMKHRLPGHWEGGKIPPGKENYPVVNVSWHDAVAFCEWLSRETGKPFRLPTEAEWEKAARGTDGRIYPWGDGPPTAESCNFDDNVKDTTPVGRYSPQRDSPSGCADVAGNVWEWTRSLLGDYPYNPADGRGGVGASHRVLRGGAFSSGSRFVRCACRFWSFPDIRDDGLGFRVVASPVSDSES
jgi:formylglycine-generating enzyme required for sulfatase activity